MSYSILEAHAAERNQEIPIGAAAFIANKSLIVRKKSDPSLMDFWPDLEYSVMNLNHPEGSLVTTHNHVQRGRNPLLHAEIILLQLLCRHMKSPFLEHVWIFSTLEPCALCAAALIRHRVAGVVFGAYNPQEGGVVHQKFPKHISVIGGVRELECQNLLDNFFLRQRSKIAW